GGSNDNGGGACRRARRCPDPPNGHATHRQPVDGSIRPTRLWLPPVPIGVPLHHSLGRRIRLLQVDAPVSQFLKRDSRAGYGAADESAGPYDAKIAVQVFDFGLSRTRGPTICTIEQGEPPSPMSRLSSAHRPRQNSHSKGRKPRAVATSAG